MKKATRSAWIFLGFSALISNHQTLHATVIELETHFSTSATGLNIWGPGDARNRSFSEELLSIPEFDKSFTLGVQDWGDTELVSDTVAETLTFGQHSGSDFEFGWQFDGRLRGDIGVGQDDAHRVYANANTTTGAIVANLPYDIRLEIPDHAQGGDTIEMRSSATLKPGASFRTSTGVDISLEQYFLYTLSETDYDICGGFPGFGTSGSDPDCIDFDPPHINLNYSNTGTQTILDFDEGIHTPFGDSSASLGEPHIETQSELDNGRLISSGENTLGSYENLELIPAKKITGYNFDYGGFGIGYSLLSVTSSNDMRFFQDFELESDLYIRLDFGNGITYFFKAGDTLTLTLPDNWKPEDGFHISYVLHNNLLNHTRMSTESSIQLKALEFNIKTAKVNLPLGLGSVGRNSEYTLDPLYEYDIVNNFTSFDLFKDTLEFELQNSGQRVSLAGTPENSGRIALPSSMPLLVAGLLGMAYLRGKILNKAIGHSDKYSLNQIG